jgi:hypothetical protein
MNCFKLCSFQINFWVGTVVSAAPDRPPLARIPMHHNHKCKKPSIKDQALFSPM